MKSNNCFDIKFQEKPEYNTLPFEIKLLFIDFLMTCKHCTRSDAILKNRTKCRITIERISNENKINQIPVARAFFIITNLVLVYWFN